MKSERISPFWVNGYQPFSVQKAMSMLFNCSTDNIGLHLKNIYDSGDLDEKATTEKISVVRQKGTREVSRSLQFYNLNAVISVGYRVNSVRATQFRQRLCAA